MSRARLTPSITSFTLGLLLAGVAAGQPSGEEPAEREEPVEERIYLQEEPDWLERRWAFGIGVGLVELGDNVVEGGVLAQDDDVETYLTVNLRIPIGDRRAHRGSGGSSGFRAFLEPEIGYWEADLSSDTLFGLNLIGAMPMNAVEFFIGGGVGVHILEIDQETLPGIVFAPAEDEALGVNAQFGLDVSLGETFALFAVGRFDLVDDSRDEFEGKAYLGLRFRF